MILKTFLAGSLFLAGMAAGVFLCDYDMLTADHLRKGGAGVVKKFRVVHAKINGNETTD